MIEMNLEKFIVVSKDGTKILTGKGFKKKNNLEFTRGTPFLFDSLAHAKEKISSFIKKGVGIETEINYVKVMVKIYEKIENTN